LSESICHSNGRYYDLIIEMHRLELLNTATHSPLLLSSGPDSLLRSIPAMIPFLSISKLQLIILKKILTPYRPRDSQHLNIPPTLASPPVKTSLYSLADSLMVSKRSPIQMPSQMPSQKRGLSLRFISHLHTPVGVLLQSNGMPLKSRNVSPTSVPLKPGRSC